MDASLVICTKDKQRAVIRFFYADGVEGVDLHGRMSVQYGNSVKSQRIFCETIKRFKNAHTSVKHEKGAGRRSTYVTNANTERVRDMMLHNRRVIFEVAHQLQISHGSTYEIIHNRLAFHNVCTMGLRGTHRISQRETFGHLQTAFGSQWCSRRPLLGKNLHRRLNMDLPLRDRE